MSSPPRVVIAGGGAAGFFAALSCAEACPGAAIQIFERSPDVLAKVRVSGGGRCNVTHACFDPAELVKNYPRGGRELLGPFHRFQPRDTVAWFEARGVPLKTEADGRMFPVSDSSQTIIDCLTREAARLGVKVRTHCGIAEILKKDSAFNIWLTEDGTVECDCLLLATGGSRGLKGHGLAAALGHTIVEPVPSLFTFHIDDDRLRGLAGISTPTARAQVVGMPLEESGALLITHWGLSGPCILRTSAWGARLLAERDYKFSIQVQWLGDYDQKRAAHVFQETRAQHPRKHIANWSPVGLPQRLWERLVTAAKIPAEATWAGLSKESAQALARELCAGEFHVAGKSMYKEEFVTCGGVALKEVDFRTMQSRVCPGLFLAGEVLDIDAVTGGFNFQSAWTTGWIAGQAMGALERHSS
jgi:predicted Rossmann fold flavoprotein